jgi:hypothetical protein
LKSSRAEPELGPAAACGAPNVTTANSAISAGAAGDVGRERGNRRMKLFLEIVIAVFLHPIAFILMLINLIGRTDLSGFKKAVWGIGPILYLVVADGAFW